MSSSAPTITDLKKSFLNSQIRGPLATELRVPRRGLAVQDDEGEVMREGIVEEVVLKMNAILRRHNRSVYTSQAIRHVAEQIDALYWASGEDVNRAETEEGDEVFSKETDYRKDENITALPEEWPDDVADDENSQAERARYIELQGRLKALNARRNETQQKLATYRHLQQLLEPFNDPTQNVQPNLVTKDGELGKELERMRMLMARVAGRIDGLKGQGDRRSGTEDVTMKSEREKVDEILQRR